MATAGDRIEQAARKKGLSYGTELAQKLGVSYETLRRWKTGHTAPNRQRQAKIAQVLGVDPSFFMHGVGAPPDLNPLSADEESLLSAYRCLLARERHELLATAERLAADVRDLEARLAARKSGRVK